MMSRDRIRWQDHALGFALAAGYVVLLLMTAKSIGYARDEGFYFGAAESYARWFEVLWAKPSEAMKQAVIDRSWSVNHEHPGLVKSAFALSWTLLYKKWHLFHTEGTSFRFPGMVASGSVLWILYIWGTRARSRIAGLVAACAFAFMPRVFYHAHLACFDLPIVAAWLGCAYAYWRSLSGGGFRWALATAVMFGLALDTKHNSWFLPIAFVGHAMLSVLLLRLAGVGKGSVRLPWALPLMAVFGPLVFFALWPWIWHDTFARLQEYVRFHTGHEYYNMEFLGTTYWKAPMPRGYAWLMTVATVPAITLLCAIIGLSHRIFDRLRFVRLPSDRAGTALLWAIGIGVNYAAWLSPGTPIFGGTKHWMTAYPFLALFAGVGVDWAIRRAKESQLPLLSWRGIGPAAIGAACLAAPVAETIHSTPWGLSNYTPLVGGASGAATLGLNRGFWGFTTGAVLPWLNQNAPRNAEIHLHDTAMQAWQMYARDKSIRPDLRVSWSPADGTIGLYHYEPHMAGVEYQYWIAYGTTAPAFVPLYDGVPVIWLYARPAGP